MQRSRRTRAVVALAAGLAAPLLAGCGVGVNATSIKPYAPSDGTMAETGTLRILNALVVASPGVTSGVVSASIVDHDQRSDRLTGLTSPDGTVDLTGSGEIPAGGALRLGAGTSTAATITGLTKLPGEAITLKLTFARSQPVTLRTVVVPATGPYATITPAPTASAG